MRYPLFLSTDIHRFTQQLNLHRFLTQQTLKFFYLLQVCAGRIAPHPARGAGADGINRPHFLLRWLAAAQKQRRFPRSVASDIDALLILGRRKGMAASLHERMKYLWCAGSGHVEQKSDLSQLSTAIEALKLQGWENSTASPEEWQTHTLQPLIPGSSVLFVQKTELVHSFTAEGRLWGAVHFQVIGDTDIFVPRWQTRT